MIEINDIVKKGYDFKVIEEIDYATATYAVKDAETLTVDDVINFNFNIDYDDHMLDGESVGTTLQFINYNDPNLPWIEIEVNEFDNLRKNYNDNQIDEFIEFLFKNY